ncbi:MAG: SPOR domain-containing protein [Alphaproteobacteria bacterium]|nr:MAG: SPOR domain-containing protein [Alphaproteobacteria bacterium]
MKFTAHFRMALLASTGLVIAGCNSIPGHTASADPAMDQKPIAQTSGTSDKDGLSENQMMRLAARTWQKGEAATAMGLYASAAKERPNDPEPLLRIAEILRKTGRPDNAIHIYRKALAIAPSNVTALNGIGYSQVQAGKPYLATQSFAASLAVDGKDSAALNGMGVAYDKAGEHGKAQDYYRKAIKAADKNLNYQSNLALSLALAGKTDQAIAILKVVAANPRATAKHRQNLALVYGMAGQSVEAMKYSRMDLSEQQARNNALYFQALNEAPDQEMASLNAQFKIMKASANDVEVARNSTNDEPRLPVNPDVLQARNGTEYIGTGANRKAPVPAIRNPQHLTPASKAPTVMASTEKQAEKPVTPLIKADNSPVKTKPSPESPAALAKASEPVKPAVNQKEEVRTAKVPEKAAEEKPAVMAKTEPKPTGKPMVAAKADVKPDASKSEVNSDDYREWTMEKRNIPVASSVKVENPAGKTAVVASIAPEKAMKTKPVAEKETASKAAALPVTYAGPNSEVAPMMEKTVAYHPDGGKYFLQIGSYKEMAQAENGWKILQNANMDLLDGIDPVINSVDLGADKGGTFYRLQIGGFENKTRTMQLCGTLRDRNYGCFMASPVKATVPVKPSPAEMVGPGQQMADKAAPGKADPANDGNDKNLVADFNESFDAF